MKQYTCKAVCRVQQVYGYFAVCKSVAVEWLLSKAVCNVKLVYGIMKGAAGITLFGKVAFHVQQIKFPVRCRK